MSNTIDGDSLGAKNAPQQEAAFKAVVFGAIAGVAGGLTEIAVVALYSAGIGSDPAIVARGVTAATGLVSVMPASPIATGILIHMAIAVVLGIALAFVWKTVRPHFSAGASLLPFMLAALTAIWAVNFFLVFPTVSPAFVHRLPYSVSLASKLLFGAAAAALLRLSDAETAHAKSVRFIEAPKTILESVAV